MNEFYLGNSLNIMEEWNSDRFYIEFDLILTDPMYNLPEREKEYVHTILNRFIKPTGTIIVFSPPENQWILPADQYGFWIKPISTKNTSKKYSRFVEMIFFYGNGTWNSGRHWSQYTNVFTDLVDTSKIHPFRKPPSLIQRLILNHTNPGDTVFDPFCGSGVVGDVCKQLGRNSICIDTEIGKYRTDYTLYERFSHTNF